MITLNKAEIDTIMDDLGKQDFNKIAVAKEVLSYSKANLLKDNAWYGTFSFRINYKPIEQDKDFTVGVGWDGFQITMFYNPLFVTAVAKHNNELMKLIFQHEIEHIVRQHIFNTTYFMQETIAKKYHPIWNIAGDAIINNRLGMSVVGEKYEMVHRGEHTTVTLDGKKTNIENISQKSIVEVFKTLLKNHKNQMDNGSGQYVVMRDLDGIGEESEESAAENTYLRKQILKGLCDVTSRLAGNTPGHLEQYIKQLAVSKIPFTRLLRNLLSKHYGKPKKTRMRISRTIKVGDFVFPGLNNYGNSKIVVSIDVSGSIDQKLFQQFMTEIDRASDLVDVFFVTFDAGITQFGKYKKGLWRKLKYSGGGTDFNVLWKFLKGKSLLQYPLFVLSDGYAEHVKSDKIDVYWCFFSNEKAKCGITLNITE